MSNPKFSIPSSISPVLLIGIFFLVLTGFSFHSIFILYHYQTSNDQRTFLFLIGLTGISLLLQVETLKSIYMNTAFYTKLKSILLFLCHVSMLILIINIPKLVPPVLLSCGISFFIAAFLLSIRDFSKNFQLFSDKDSSSIFLYDRHSLEIILEENITDWFSNRIISKSLFNPTISSASDFPKSFQLVQNSNHWVLTSIIGIIPTALAAYWHLKPNKPWPMNLEDGYSHIIIFIALYLIFLFLNSLTLATGLSLSSRSTSNSRKSNKFPFNSLTVRFDFDMEGFYELDLAAHTTPKNNLIFELLFDIFPNYFGSTIASAKYTGSIASFFVLDQDASLSDELSLSGKFDPIALNHLIFSHMEHFLLNLHTSKPATPSSNNKKTK